MLLVLNTFLLCFTGASRPFICPNLSAIAPCICDRNAKFVECRGPSVTNALINETFASPYVLNNGLFVDKWGVERYRTLDLNRFGLHDTQLTTLDARIFEFFSFFFTFDIEHSPKLSGISGTDRSISGIPLLVSSITVAADHCAFTGLLDKSVFEYAARARFLSVRNNSLTRVPNFCSQKSRVLEHLAEHLSQRHRKSLP